MIDWPLMASVGLVAARLLLSITFLVAAGGKLVHPVGGRQTLIDFGVPHLAAGLATALPLVELTIGSALIVGRFAWFGSVGALTLLLLFALAIGANLAVGRAPVCNCFGAIHSAPVGWSTLARNAVLSAAAGFVVWQGQADPGPDLIRWPVEQMTFGRAAFLSVVLGLALAGAQVALLVQILRQQGRILLRLDALDARSAGVNAALQQQGRVEGLPVGSPVPSFRLDGVNGESAALEDLLDGVKPVFLLFTDPGCGPCDALLPEVSRWQQEHSGDMTLALVSEGTAASNQAKMDEHRLRRVLLQQKREVAAAYQVRGTPAAIVIQPNGVIGSAIAMGADAINSLVAQTVSGALHRNSERAAPSAIFEPVKV